MNIQAVYHRSTDQYCYPLDNDNILLSIQTAKDVIGIDLIADDPFKVGILGAAAKWEGQRYPITEVVELKNHLLWSIKIKPEYKRLKYYFELTDENKNIFMCVEEGVYTQAEFSSIGYPQTFNYAWLNSNDVIKTPAWVMDTVWYQIFPDRFNRIGDAHGYENWELTGKVNNEQVFGGNILGIIDKLPYLNKLGINGIYLTPIFKANTVHKYDTVDYYEIDSEFGTKEQFAELIQKAHALGIRVMLDAVFNHTSTDFAPWQDILKKKEQSEFKDWYMINDYNRLEGQNKTTDKQFYSFAFTEQMPKLNTNNSQVQEYLIDVMTYWVKEYDIDGWRLDVANEVSHDFWRNARKALVASKPDVYILGEVWYDSINWLRGEQFDSVMNYPLTNAIIRFVNDREMSTKDFEYLVNRCYSFYPRQVNAVLFNLLDSHDTARLINQVNHNHDKFWQAIVILLTMQGSPSIYYGTEVMLEGAHDPDCRRPMPWQVANYGFDSLSTLIDIRKNNSCLKESEIIWTSTEKRLLSYQRGNITVIINQGEDRQYNVKGKIIFNRGYDSPTLYHGGILLIDSEN